MKITDTLQGEKLWGTVEKNLRGLEHLKNT